jgi:hypothetical protein
MTMARGVSEIDRLIEEGLSLYGEGDLDGALLLWERVLVMDPENPQANSYVDYVRMNYELLTSDQGPTDGGPFGIASDEPEYQIEILPGEGSGISAMPAAPAAAAAPVPPPAPAPPRPPLYMDEHENGWGIGEDPGGPSPLPGTLTLELEADEPPAGGDPPTFETRTGEEVSFEAATREYPGGAGRPTHTLLGHDQPALDPSALDPEFAAEITPGFGGPEDFQTPQGFGSQTTDIRRRDLGFVQPTDGERRGDPGPPELKMTLRTPGAASSPGLVPAPAAAPPAEAAQAPAGAVLHRAQTADADADAGQDADNLDLDLPPPPPPGSTLASAYASLELDLPPLPGAAPTEELSARAETRPAVPGAIEAATAELIASLPMPRPPAATTRPLPSSTRPPFDPAAPQATPEDDRATRDLTLEPTEPTLKVAVAPTQELPHATRLDPRLAVHADPPPPPPATRDFADKPTNQLPGRALAPRPADDSLITAPTRELGLRELGLRPERRLPTDDEATTQVDVHKVRAGRGNGKAEILGMDPIDARSTEILEQIDRGAPAIETREERTRRRITALLDRAAAWSRDAELDRAVTAVDLALSEDPNSALAQKLIHRNREAIMNAFQAFLGDLQRTPNLARPLHELGSAPISPRAAFLLSRVDGTLSLDEILDVSGMPRLEAYRYLCQLFLRGILR